MNVPFPQGHAPGFFLARSFTVQDHGSPVRLLDFQPHPVERGFEDAARGLRIGGRGREPFPTVQHVPGLKACFFDLRSGRDLVQNDSGDRNRRSRAQDREAEKNADRETQGKAHSNSEARRPAPGFLGDGDPLLADLEKLPLVPAGQDQAIFTGRQESGGNARPHLADDIGPEPLLEPDPLAGSSVRGSRPQIRFRPDRSPGSAAPRGWPPGRP